MKKNPLLKIAAVSFIGIIVLWIIQALVVGMGNSFGISFQGNMLGHNFRGGMNVGNGFYFGGTITSLLLILIKVLFVIFVLGLIGGLVVWVKNNVFTTEEREAIKNTFTGKAAKKEVCSCCNKELNSDWKACPYCGKEKLAVNNDAPIKETENIKATTTVKAAESK